MSKAFGEFLLYTGLIGAPMSAIMAIYAAVVGHKGWATALAFMALVFGLCVVSVFVDVASKLNGW